LDTPDKRKGQQKLFFSPASALFAVVEKECKNCEEPCITDSANAEFAENLRKDLHELTQNMRITKETIQN
ncbi:MAG: hypothetical protein WC223_13380, partial [Bacteroidales bacterium]